MAARLFGTDGVRGVANRDLSADLALALGRAAARVLHSNAGNALVGRDTRPSGDLLRCALMAGLMSMGVDVVDAGIVPTPALAWLTRKTTSAFGVMISASHNPVPDNGIKLFRGDGFKLEDDTEDAIEAALGEASGLPTGMGVGRVAGLTRDSIDAYVDHLRGLGGDVRLGKVVVDAAHGAATTFVREVFEPLCRELIVIHGEPDGARINVDCGSTHPATVAAAVREHEADLGLAFDGDADRLIAVDDQGVVMDGDEIMAVLATRLQQERRLGEGVALTVMSNLGLRRYLGSLGLQVVETKVGDRYVLEALRRDGLWLGGEQSGHIVYLPENTTGDGLQTAVMLLSTVGRGGAPLSRIRRCFERFPQRLQSVRVSDTRRLMADERLDEAVHAAERALGDRGRVLVRASGTEPVLRVMVEAEDAGLCSLWLQRLVSTVKELEGGHAVQRP